MEKGRMVAKMTKEEAIAYGAYHLDQVILVLQKTDDYARRCALEKRKDFLLTAMVALEEVEDG